MPDTQTWKNVTIDLDKNDRIVGFVVNYLRGDRQGNGAEAVFGLQGSPQVATDKDYVTLSATADGGFDFTRRTSTDAQPETKHLSYADAVAFVKSEIDQVQDNNFHIGFLKANGARMLEPSGLFLNEKKSPQEYKDSWKSILDGYANEAKGVHEDTLSSKARALAADYRKAMKTDGYINNQEYAALHAEAKKAQVEIVLADNGNEATIIENNIAVKLKSPATRARN